MNLEILEILKISEKEGIKLVLEGDKLSIKSKKTTIDSDLLEKIKNQKEVLISYLKKHQKGTSHIGAEGNIIAFDRTELQQIPLSFNQERLWFIDQLQGSSEEYHIPTIIRLEGELNTSVLEQALKTIVDRHEVLRTNILSEEGIGYQEVVGSDNWFLGSEKVVGEEELSTRLQNYITVPFNLASDYKLRACLYDLGDNKYVLACVFHHIASDGWSENILTNEFVELYSALKSEREVMLPELNLQYIDYAIWQRKYFEGDILDAQLNYWEDKLKGVSTLTLPLNYTRPQIQSNAGADVSTIIDESFSKSLKDLCQQEGVTMPMLLLSVFKLLLSRHSGQDDICVGTSIANRTQSELEGMIGFFVNTLALRTDLSGNPSFRDFLGRVKTTTLEGYKNQQTPFEKIVDRVVTSRDMSTTPLFQVMFDYQNEGAVSEEEKGEADVINADIAIGDLSIEPYEYTNTSAQFDLTLNVSEEGGGIVLSINYCTDLFDETSIERMLEHYKVLLSTVVNNIEQSIGRLPMLTQPETTQLLEVFNETSSKYDLDRTVIDVFKEQVKKGPNAIAAVFEGEELSYEELDKRSNQLAHYILEQGIRSDDLVGICLDRGLDMLVAVLGVLKSGGAYVPIKPDFPMDRISHIIADTKCSLVITDELNELVLESLFEDTITLVAIDENDVLYSKYPGTGLELSYNSGDLAYIIYTSGSTGVPKGAMIEHAGLLNHLLIMIDELHMDDQSVVAFTAPFTFDISVWQLLSALLCGGSITIYSEEKILDINGFQASLTNHKISHLQLVPSYLASLLEAQIVVEGLSALSYFLITGEAVNKSLLNKWFTLYPNVPVVNAYGPAEAADDITLHIMSESPEGDFVPIGKPVANMNVYIVDRFNNLCPVGIVGELWTSGIGVGRGYLNREELTKEKFTVDSFSKNGNRLYKTGDLGKWLPDGTLEFIGRSDDQVKVRGYRIELGEIESILSQIEGVQKSCVLAKDDGEGTNRLVGYVVLDSRITKEVIQEKLKASLPDYMVPTIWIILDEIPLTVNGKIDKKSLPEPDSSELSSRKYVAPRNETEELLVTVWQELLRVDKIGVNDDFFELGGHSLLATRLVSMIRTKMSVEILIRDIFEYTTISELSVHISAPSTGVTLPPVILEERPERIPLSFSQERLWFLDELQGTSEYHMPIAIRLKGELNVTALEQSLKTIVERHEILRTNIVSEEGVGYQEVKKADSWFLLQENSSAETIEGSISEYQATPFNLDKDFKLRACLYNLEDENYVLAVVLHHIASDGWSEDILINEFLELYSSLQKGNSFDLPALNLQYSDYAIWQRKYLEGEVLADQLAYWEKKLKGVDSLKLPLDFERPATQRIEGGNTYLALNEDLTNSVRELCRNEGVTMFMFLLSTFKVLLHRYSGQDDICIGTPIANRTQSDLEGMIGFFVNTLALRSDLSENPSFKDFLKQVKETTLEAYDHQLTPFEKVVDKVVVTRDMSTTPLFQVMFMTENTSVGLTDESETTLDFGGVEISEFESDNIPSKFDITLSIAEGDSDILLNVNYCTALFEKLTIDRMLEHFRELLNSVVKDSTQSVGSLTMLTEEEETKLVTAVNNTEADYPTDKTVVDVFVEQALKAPEAIALVYKNEGLTYEELDERSNQLASYLSSLGVQSNTFVGICMERSIEMLVGILGVLKSGGAYVPIDPAYPKERIDYMLGDAGISIVLTNGTNNEAIKEKDGMTVVALDNDWKEIENHKKEGTNKTVISNNLAYVIYTSGSTGKPKGVPIYHSSLMNYITTCSNQYLGENTSGSYMHLSASFDASMTEIFTPLVNGKMLVISSGSGLDTFKDENLEKYAPYSFIKLTPSHLELLDPVLRKTKNIADRYVLGGEALQPNHLSTFTELNIDSIIINEYGPTEATVGTTTYSFNTLDKHSFIHTFPIGIPMPNMQIYVLDKNLNLVPKGVTGELCIGGVGVSKGYLNREELNKEKFIDNPFKEGDKIYKTGDLGRWLPDGNLEFIGRKDDQVKIRGYRVELGEVENALSTLLIVNQCCVLAKEDVSGTKQLVGYVVSEGSFDKEELQTELKKTLPGYMIPALWVELEEMPLTVNGKLDKKALPEIDGSVLSTKEYVAPRNESEEKLIEIWQQLLGIEKIGVYDDFFELGGHSLLATRLVSLIRKELEKEIAIREIFEYTTIADLALHIATQSKGVLLPEIIAENRDERIPLSFSQERLWFLDQFEGTLAYHIPAIMHIEGELDIDVLEKALKTIVSRHEILRTNLFSSEGIGYQEIVSAENWSLEKKSVSGKSELDKQIHSYLTTPFNLSSDYKLRSCLYDLGANKFVLACIFHHIASDGWSEAILTNEFTELYDALKTDREVNLPELTLQYADYAIWQRKYLEGEILDRQLGYWENKLTGVSTLALPTDYIRPSVQGTAGATFSIDLGEELSGSLKELYHKEGVTPFMFLLASFKVLLARYSGQEDICVGTPIANRTQYELEGMIGFFTNTLALRSDLSGDINFKELLHQVKTTTLEGYDNQLTPFERVVDRVVTTRDVSMTPLFQVMFDYNSEISVVTDEVEENTGTADLLILPHDFSETTAQFDLMFNVNEEESNIFLNVVYCTDLFKEETIARMLENYKTLLKNIVVNIEQPIGDIPMLSQQEETQLLDIFNDTSKEYPLDETVIDLFKRKAQETPEAIAAVFEGDELSYAELDQRSNQLAHYLIDQGVQRDNLVGICLERGLDMIVGILGILKAGGAYVPIKPDFPMDRISYIIEDTDCSIVVTDSLNEFVLESLFDEAINLIAIDDEDVLDSDYPVTDVELSYNPNDLAYIIYTSGSTGLPKGAMIEHAGLLNHLLLMIDELKMSDESVVAFTAPFTFDISVWQMLSALICGGCIAVYNEDTILDIDNFQSSLEEDNVSHLQLVPSYIASLLQGEEVSKGLSGLSYFLVTGEAATKSLLDMWFSLYPSIPVVNAYGPAEAADDVTLHIMEKSPSGVVVPIGKPVANMDVYVVDQFENLCPIGVVGEIWTSGIGVGRGYLNRDELTKEKFIENPFITEGGRLYKTGDLGRWLSNGTLEFVGRSDDQVKIRGYRIELGEIENALSQVTGIQNSCVLAKEDTIGTNRLIGYVVVEDEFNKEKVQEELKRSLPEYMIPMLWIALDEMPLTANGKIDKKSLPEPDSSELSAREYVAPTNESEEQMAAIWQELLGIERVGIHDDFFELGGHSLLATRLVSMIRKELKKEIEIAGVFEFTVLVDLAAHVSELSEGVRLPSILAEERPERIPLSFSQERIWFIDQLQGTLAYHMPVVIYLEGNLDKTNLETTIKTIVARHEVLRTNILSADGYGYQEVRSHEEWSLSRETISENELEASLGKYLTIPFDLANDYKLRARLYDLGENKYALACVFHHIASDGWSEDILIQEFNELYASLQIGKEAILPELSLQYADYAIWQRKYFEGEVLENQLSYWEQKLTNASVLELPTDFMRPAIQETEGANITINLNEELGTSIKTLSKQENVTTFMFLLSAFKVLLARYSGQDDICIGTPIANRTQSELEGMIGFFVNTLVLRSDLSDDISFKELLSQVKTTTLEGYDNQLAPFEKVVDKVVKNRDMSTTPLFQVMFSLENTTGPAVELQEVEEEFEPLAISPYESETVSSQFDITLDVTEVESTFELSLTYSTTLFKEETIVRMLEHYKELLASIVNNVELSVGEVAMLTEKEETQLLNVFNAAEVTYPLDKTVVDLFTDQVQKCPKAIALTFEGTEFSYEELDKRSNQLAHCLVSQGVKSDDLIGICLERGLDMVVGVFGILKAGGAYVPMKPDFPKDRIEYLLEDTGCSHVVTDLESQEIVALSSDTIQLIAIENVADYATIPVKVEYRSYDLAYVIYTSGSTGLPKGAMIEHAGLLNHLLLMVDELKMTNESVVAFTAPFTFDISVWQMLSALLCGGSVAIYSEESILDIDDFQSSIEENNVSHLQLVPSYVTSLLESGNSTEGLSNLSHFLVTGEAATKSLLDKWFLIYPNVPVVNAYGPAEAADDITLHIMNTTPVGATVPIGKPVANMDVYVVDRFENLCPIGVVGELWTAGIGVGRGYLNRAELTEEKFIENPFSENGGRLYKTGDLGRWLPDGTLEFVGRSDDQVKIRGYRIELGEIENTLSQVSSVLNCCVLAMKDQNEIYRLVGYVVTEGEFNKDKIQNTLKDSLPDYMVPMLWISLDEMPLTANGKIDKKSLPEPDSSQLSTKEYIAPRNEIEQELVSIWQDLLGIEKIGINDDFFELGGHSLLIVQLIARLQKIGYHIAVRDIFLNPCITGIIEKMVLSSSMYITPPNGITKDTEVITPSMVPLLNFDQQEIDAVVAQIEGGVSNIEDIYPLSPLQEGIYFHYLMSNESEGDPYILPTLLSFANKEKRTSFVEALQFVVNRHDVLRTAFLSEGLPNTVQVVFREAELSVEEYVVDCDKDLTTELEELAAPGRHWMDVSKAPLLKLKSIDDPENEICYVVVYQHHLALDHIGLEKVVSEIVLYLSGKESELPTPVLYRDFIGHTLHQQATNDSESYFKGLLGGIQEPTYPFGLTDTRDNFSDIKEAQSLIPEKLGEDLRNISISLGMSPAVLFHAAFGLVVGRCSNTDYAIFGSLLLGRLQGSLGAADSLGLFINTLPFLTELKGTISEYIAEVKKALTEMLAYEQTPLSDVHSWSGISNELPIFSALMNYRHSTSEEEEEEMSEELLQNEDVIDLGLAVTMVNERTNYPISLDIDDFGKEFELTAQIDGDINPEQFLGYIEEALNQLVVALKEEQNITVDSLTILPKEDVQLLETFNNTDVAYPLDKTVVDLFADQVLKSPEAIAAVFEGEELTYKELNQRSNKLAHYLIDEGVKTDDLIGICLDRNLDMLVGVLAILKSGGAYVPIKPDFPMDRISYMVEDTGCSLVITDELNELVLESLFDDTIKLISLNEEDIADFPDSGIEMTYSSNDLAYIIYTSGSTGLPKGAMIEHAGLLNHLLLMVDDLKMNEKSAVAFTAPFTFDISVWQMLSGLLCGGKIVIYSEESILDIFSFQESLCSNKVSHLQLVPSYVSSILDEGAAAEGLANLQYFLVTGEAATKPLLEKWFSSYPNVPVVNAYGPAEAADDVTLHIMNKAPEGVAVPIGKPVANMDMYVVDQFDHLCPIGVIGELWTSGIGVGRGYLNRAELTKEKFVANPFTEDEGRLYKTGDLGKWLPDGTLEFVGRTDDQVKIRGYRIELGEIENTIVALDSISQCCVLAKKDPTGVNRLVAYLVVEEGANQEELQEAVSESLPNYMIPQLWFVLEEMPLTANGKIDKKALPEPDLSQLSDKEYLAPRNETEEQLVAIWQELLGIEKISVYDDFFDLGGHSLLATRLVSMIRTTFETEVSIREIFEETTIEEQASLIEIFKSYLEEEDDNETDEENYLETIEI
ncbi:amino acid adenylation domain-containing protein [Tenacibaculum sp. MAR_2009_124]|uniref:non-ribosomal peptide synthetase n=1 Tax=Tenacibaculum sp. MAR_2009_124 TaxID=1250059 RepID=UPI00089A2392|nr:non-ribosomal peptide synthetase [Tenacibaculum sp. MAR_2009_124]SEB35202.1 amino acid adenylation domain-containing protein [Tenacibaculum sp. MAR_2009_124]